jgi:hypothetical protein
MQNSGVPTVVAAHRHITFRLSYRSFQPHIALTPLATISTSSSPLLTVLLPHRPQLSPALHSRCHGAMEAAGSILLARSMQHPIEHGAHERRRPCKMQKTRQMAPLRRMVEVGRWHELEVGTPDVDPLPMALRVGEQVMVQEDATIVARDAWERQGLHQPRCRGGV